ncbi:MAG: ABC transporter ATP-binding protein [Sneathiella sp.]|uniref:ABC transporter ATP-binding protein n=1 Tax=Sneathiella sp. TaxID=1964365 RepID=UPI0030011CA8
MTRLLDIKNVTVRFGGVTAIDDVTFHLDEGELLGFIGPNGAGKTTMMRAITGVVTPQEGSIQLMGQELIGMPIHARIRKGMGLSQQLVRPLRNLSVLDNVALAAGYRKTANPLAALFKTDKRAERKTALKILERVGIADAADAEPANLSLGYLKRLEVARALALDPKVVLLDEPLAGLNHAEAGRLADTIKDLQGDGMTIILIEHNLGEVMRICTRLVVQDNGRKIGDGPPEVVMKDPVVRRAYLGGEDENAAA